MTKYLFLLLSVFSVLFSQAQTKEEFVQAGISYHDEQNYAKAIENYNQAIALDPDYGMAYYEKGFSLFKLKKYEESIELMKVALDKSEHTPTRIQAYVSMGNCYDISGKPKKALKAYKRGLKKEGEHYLLYFNRAITLINLGDYEDSEEDLIKGISLNPFHASSHNLMAVVESRMQKEIHATLAYQYFLMLEPASQRAAPAYNQLKEVSLAGASRDGALKINITVATERDHEFGSSEVMVGLLKASYFTDTTDYPFHTWTGTLISTLKVDEKYEGGFWEKQYLDFFKALKESPHFETYNHYIAQSVEQDSFDWLGDNKDKVAALEGWIRGYYDIGSET